MSYDKTTGRTDIELFSSDDYDYKDYKVKPGSVLDQFLEIYDTEIISNNVVDQNGNSKVEQYKGVVRAAGEQIKHETYIMIHVFPMFMIAYGKLVKDEEQKMFGGDIETDYEKYKNKDKLFLVVKILQSKKPQQPSTSTIDNTQQPSTLTTVNDFIHPTQLMYAFKRVIEQAQTFANPPASELDSLLNMYSAEHDEQNQVTISELFNKYDFKLFDKSTYKSYQLDHFVKRKTNNEIDVIRNHVNAIDDSYFDRFIDKVFEEYFKFTKNEGSNLKLLENKLVGVSLFYSIIELCKNKIENLNTQKNASINEINYVISEINSNVYSKDEQNTVKNFIAFLNVMKKLPIQKLANILSKNSAAANADAAGDNASTGTAADAGAGTGAGTGDNANVNADAGTGDNANVNVDADVDAGTGTGTAANVAAAAADAAANAVDAGTGTAVDAVDAVDAAAGDNAGNAVDAGTAANAGADDANDSAANVDAGTGNAVDAGTAANAGADDAAADANPPSYGGGKVILINNLIDEMKKIMEQQNSNTSNTHENTIKLIDKINLDKYPNMSFDGNYIMLSQSFESKQSFESEIKTKIDDWIKTIKTTFPNIFSKLRYFKNSHNLTSEEKNTVLSFVAFLETLKKQPIQELNAYFNNGNQSGGAKEIQISKLITDLKKIVESHGWNSDEINKIIETIDDNIVQNHPDIYFDGKNIIKDRPTPDKNIPPNKNIQIVKQPKDIYDVKDMDETHSKFMLLVLTTLAKIDELRAPGWLEAIRATIGSIINIFDEDSSMSNFIKAIGEYDENKNKYRAKMYAEVSLLRNDDRLNGQPKCDDAPIDVDIHVDKTGPSAITKINSALNTITHGLEQRPKITTNPVGLEAGANPSGSGYNLNVNSFGDQSTVSANKQPGSGSSSLNTGATNDNLNDANDNGEAKEMLGGSYKLKKPFSRRLHKLSAHNKKNKTRRVGLRAQFGFK